MWALSWVLAALIGLVVTGAMGREMLQAILADEFRERVPGWLEGISPLKGRWLRCLLAGPALAAFMGTMFLAVTFLSWLVVLTVGYGGIMFLGMLGGR